MKQNKKKVNKFELKYLKDIEHFLKNEIETKNVVKVSNELNEYIDYKKFKKYFVEIKGKDSKKLGSFQSISGRFVEELIFYIFTKYKEKNETKWEVFHQTDEKITKYKNWFSLIHRKKVLKKSFDIDIWIKNKESNKFFLISCKASVRERIGQFLSSLILMDHRIIKEKFNDEWKLEFKEQEKLEPKKIKVKYELVVLDWTSTKDFLKLTKKGKKRASLKEVEVNLIVDDDYDDVGGGITSINNYDNFDKIKNFEELMGSINKFFNKK